MTTSVTKREITALIAKTTSTTASATTTTLATSTKREYSTTAAAITTTAAIGTAQQIATKREYAIKAVVVFELESGVTSFVDHFDTKPSLMIQSEKTFLGSEVKECTKIF